VTPVRPTSQPSQPPAVSPQADAARTAAQRAFFQTALTGKAPPAAAPAARVTTPTVFAQPVQRIPDPAAAPPTRILRPGSLLDIKV
jgi:hypothetical protein